MLKKELIERVEMLEMQLETAEEINSNLVDEIAKLKTETPSLSQPNMTLYGRLARFFTIEN